MTSTTSSGIKGFTGVAAVLAMALGASSALAQVTDDSLYLPAAAHTAGRNGAQWRTDVALFNPNSFEVAYTVELLEQDRDNSAPRSRVFAVPAGQGVSHTDILDSVFAATGSAALRITASAPLEVSARTYNQTASGTFGQLIGAGKQSQAIKSGATATIFPLSSSASRDRGFRTNLGFVNCGATPLTVEVSLYRSTGELAGTSSYSLAPYSFTQTTDVFAIVGAGDVDAGYAKVRASSLDGAFYAYASVIDNLSGDPLYVVAE